jgi:hypothetical protein
LLALLAVEDGIAARVLGSFGITRDIVVMHLPQEAGSSPEGEIPRTVRMLRALDWADREARFLRQDYVGTEHLLLGLMRESEEWVRLDWPGPHHLSEVCLSLGISFRDVRGAVLASLNEMAGLA